MDILLALIAFSVTMIVLSTLVSAVVEVIHEIRSMRQRHFAYLVGAVFDEHIWPKFKGLADRPPTASAFAVEQTQASAPGMLGRMLTTDTGRVPFALWWAGLALAAIAILLGWFILGLAIIAALLFWYDRRRSPDWFDYPANAAVDSETLRRLTRLKGLQARETGEAEPPLEADERNKLNDLNKYLHASGILNEDGAIRDAVLAEAFEQVEQRRRFIEAIAKMSKSVIANRSGARGAFVKGLPATEFAARLARSEFGPAIADAAGDKIATVIDDIARKFDSIGEETTEVFRQRSRVWSIIAAFIVAFFANVDAVRLFEAYYKDPKIARQIEAAYDRETLERMANPQRERGDPPAPGDGKPEEDIEAAKKRAKAAVEEIRTTANELAALGAPIGWSHYPFCVRDGGPPVDPKCVGAKKDDKASENNKDDADKSFMFEFSAKASAALAWFEARGAADLTAWLMGVLLAGALIGLGGPFWFKVYQRLSSIASIARTLGLRAGAASTAATDAQTAIAKPKPEDKHKPESVVDAFNTALAADSVAQEALAIAAEAAPEDAPAAARPPLTPNGDFA